MSARTPFIPSGGASRPASRLGQLRRPDIDQNEMEGLQFLPNASNALHSTSALFPGLKRSKSALQNNNGGSNDTIEQRTSDDSANMLNMNGLLRKKGNRDRSVIHEDTSRIARDLSDAARDENADGYRRSAFGQSLEVFAPSPRVAARLSSSTIVNTLATDAIPVSGFKAPSLPLNLSSLVNQIPQESENAHISIPAAANGLSFAIRSALPGKGPGVQLPSPPNSTGARSHSSSLAEDSFNSSYMLNISSISQTGPQRVLVNSDGSRGEPAASILGYRDYAEDRGQKLRKHSREEDNTPPEIPAELLKKHNKKLKSSGNQASGPTPCHTPVLATPSAQQEYEHNVDMIGSRSQLREQRYHQNRDRVAADYPRGISRLFGQDIEAYLEQNMGKYEKAVQKWKNCTLEEWIAGADELAARYRGLLNMVIDHMTEELNLYSGLEEKLDQQRAASEHRDQVLDDVKQRLVLQSKGLLGKEGFDSQK